MNLICLAEVCWARNGTIIDSKDPPWALFPWESPTGACDPNSVFTKEKDCNVHVVNSKSFFSLCPNFPPTQSALNASQNKLMTHHSWDTWCMYDTSAWNSLSLPVPSRQFITFQAKLHCHLLFEAFRFPQGDSLQFAKAPISEMAV